MDNPRWLEYIPPLRVSLAKGPALTGSGEYCTGESKPEYLDCHWNSDKAKMSQSTNSHKDYTRMQPSK